MLGQGGSSSLEVGHARQGITAIQTAFGREASGIIDCERGCGSSDSEAHRGRSNGPSKCRCRSGSRDSVAPYRRATFASYRRCIRPDQSSCLRRVRILQAAHRKTAASGRTLDATLPSLQGAGALGSLKVCKTEKLTLPCQSAMTTSVILPTREHRAGMNKLRGCQPLPFMRDTPSGGRKFDPSWLLGAFELLDMFNGNRLSDEGRVKI